MNKTFNIIIRMELTLVHIMPVFVVYLIKRLSDALKHQVVAKVTSYQRVLLKILSD